MIKTTITSIVFVFAVHTSINLAHEKPLQRFTFSEPHMGTTFQIILYAPNKETASKASKSAFARIAELNQIMSDYQRDSELMKLCKQAGGEPKRVSADLYHVLAEAQRLAKQTDGAFDVTVGPIVRLWRRARRTRELPDAERLKEALAKVGYKKLKLESHKRLVELLVMGMLLDLGGIAKGYAADEALEVLCKFGIRRALIDAGGDITVGDAPPNRKGWKIAVAPLKDPNGKPTQFLLLKNASVATSGDASQYVEIDGTRYSHIVDPKTGLGIVGRRSVTVIAPDGTKADSLATAVCVMGPKRGMRLIEKTKGTAALYIYEEDNRLVQLRSKRLDQYKVDP